MNSEKPDDWGALSNLPGNPIMWVLIISELLVFGAILLAFTGARHFDPVTFHAGQQALDIRLGGLNTVILVTSGWLAARATHAQIRGNGRTARRMLAGAGGLGFAFLVVKGFEWSKELAQGHGLESDAFFTLFYLTTGFHAAHVIMGLVVLAIVGRHNTVENLETGTAFWHMVDLIWVMVFPVFYLTR